MSMKEMLRDFPLRNSYFSAQPPHGERTEKVASHGEHEGPAEGGSNAERDDVGDTVLKAAENEKRHAE